MDLIEVSVREDNITVTGHAGYAPPGQDIVCAAVSTLFQTLIKSIEDLAHDEISYHIAQNRANIDYGNLSEKSRTLIDSFFVGITMIASEYPDYIRVV